MHNAGRLAATSTANPELRPLSSNFQPKKVETPRISTKVDCDQKQVRQSYLRMGKAELVDRLLAVEVAYAEQEQRWLTQQDETLTWWLRAQAAEARLSGLPQTQYGFRLEIQEYMHGELTKEVLFI